MKNIVENNANISAVLLKDVIYINTASGQGSQTTISVSITNKNQTAVELKSIGILLPTTITTSPNSITPKADAAFWVFGKSPTITNQFDANAKTGKVIFNAGETLTFDLEKVKLVNTIEPEPVTITVKIKLNNNEPVFEIPLKVTLKSAKCSIDKFSVDKAVIQPGESAELSWDTNKISYCILEPNIGKKNAKGNFTIQPQISQTYTLWAYDSNTLLFAQLTVTVENIEINFTSSIGSDVTIGDMVTLNWNCNDLVQNAALSDTKHTIPASLKFTGIKARANSIKVGPIMDLTTFKFLATRDAVVTKDSLYTSKTISVDSVVDAQAVFTATPNTNIWEGSTVKLEWDIESAKAVRITPPLPNGPSLQKLKGSVEIVLNNDVTYQLEVDGFKDNLPIKLTRTIPLMAKRHDLAATFTVSPNAGVWQRDKIVISWDINNPTTVLIEPALTDGPSLQKLKGSVEIRPEADVKYTLTVTGTINNQPKTMVIPMALHVEQVRINDYRIEQEYRNPSPGYILCWNVNAPVRSISNIGNVEPNGRRDVTSPRRTTTYTITVGTEQNPSILSRSETRL